MTPDDPKWHQMTKDDKGWQRMTTDDIIYVIAIEILRHWMLIYWGIGTLRYWNIVILEYWDIGILRYWNIEILEYQDTGILIYGKDKVS